MPNVLNDATILELRPILASLLDPVRLLFFTQKNACPNCAQQEELLREVCALSDKLKLEVYDFVLNGNEVLKYKIDKIPATAVGGDLCGPQRPGCCYYCKYARRPDQLHRGHRQLPGLCQLQRSGYDRGVSRSFG